MEQKYQIIPRRFRPSRFADVSGHAPIVSTLKNALALGRVAQAYLFSGSRGCGKTTLARLLAKALCCDKLTEEHEPCNRCENCTEIGQGSYLDLLEIDGASNRGIDDIRQINETVGYAPSKGKYKIYIIDEVHMLTKEAFNALLKTLEEPPAHVKFFFATTEPHKLPQTILSRCQRFFLSRISEEAICEKLKTIAKELTVSIEEAALIQISRLSEGSLRDAESLLDQLICFGKTPITLEMTREAFGLLPLEPLFALDELIETGDIEGAIPLASSLYRSGKDIGATIEGLLEHYRVHLLIQLGSESPSPYTSLKVRFSKGTCLTLLDTLLSWQKLVQKTPFKEVHLEMLLVRLVRARRELPLDILVERLFSLEERLKQSPEPALTAPPPIAEAIREERPLPTPQAAPLPASPPRAEEKKRPPSLSEHETLLRFAAVELEGVVQQANNPR